MYRLIMKKYFLKDSGKEVKFGDFVLGTHKFGNTVTKILTTFDEDSIDVLKGLGIVIEKDVKKDVKDEKFDINFINCYLDSVYNWLANKLDVSIQGAKNYLMDLEDINPSAALNIYLKRISNKLIKKYDKTPIRELPEIYIISIYDGKVKAICPKDIKNLKHFAWFRSKEDAEFARRCVINLIEKMFGKDDQSKD